MADELVHDMRAAIRLGVVLSVEDGGQAQTVTVQAHDGSIRRGVEVMQPFGFAAAAPAAGAICVLLAIGGDPSHLVALPIAAPGARFGDQAPGEATIYGIDGSRVAIRAGGGVEIWAATEVTIHAPLVRIKGDLVVEGDISDRNGAHGTFGDLRTAYDVHTHPGVQPGGGNSGTTDHPV